MAIACWPSASWSASFSRKYDFQIEKAAKRWWPDLPWKLWKAQLFQESKLDPNAVSPVGARGLAQFMPATWDDVMRQLDLRALSPLDPDAAIDAGAYYMARLRQTWRRDRTALERNALAQASYNAGAGNIIRAQSLCGDARLWPAIAPCLSGITGPDYARETLTYVTRIDQWWRQMEME